MMDANYKPAVASVKSKLQTKNFIEKQAAALVKYRYTAMFYIAYC